MNAIYINYFRTTRTYCISLLTICAFSVHKQSLPSSCSELQGNQSARSAVHPASWCLPQKPVSPIYRITSSICLCRQNWVQLVWFPLMIAAAQSNNKCQCVSLPLWTHNAYRIGVNVHANILFVRHVMQFVVLYWFCTLNILILVVTGTDILCGEKYYVVFICLFIFNIWILWFASHSLKHSFFERSYYLNLI